MPPSTSIDQLIKKYDVPVPRYTSYPTVPYWDTARFSYDEWQKAVQRCFTETNRDKGISLYLHLPFCESLCTYCACNTRITKNHGVEVPYLQSILSEWKLYEQLFGERPVIRELHLGGGTPTFFSPENLQHLLRPILNSCDLFEDHEFSFEGHPNNTTEDHLRTLYELGFRRVSYGVQDLDPKVQKAIHRIQPFENLERVTRQSRELGYHSVSFDIVYGLPFQTKDTVENTVEKLIALKPDRFAFYSYAHVPWLKPGQRGYEDADLPGDVEKRALYECGRALFNEAGYEDIGMDHFALRHDSLAIAQKEGRLHRNFMGYTTTQTDLLLGLGTSSISDAKYAYAQNLKKVEEYSAMISTRKLAVTKGHLLTPQDLLVRRSILDIACKGKLSASQLNEFTDTTIEETLTEMAQEGLIERDEAGISLTSTGRKFVRTVCSVFDVRMKTAGLPGEPIFSKAI
jgi:oxygen-independent coproporphyrinogen III oxidase